jgi:phage protein D
MEGEDITSWVGAISMTEDDKEADNVTISIPDPRMIYSDALFEGSVVEVDLGYAESEQHALMIRATVIKVEQSFPDNGAPSLTLKGADKSILMGIKELKKVWRNMTVTNIVREIAGKYGYAGPLLMADLSPDPMVTKPINQDGKTDLAFLQDLAKTYHAKCFVELNEEGQEVLYFIPERRIVRLRRPETLILNYRMGPSSNLITFTPSFDSSYIDRLKQIEDVDQHGNKVQSPPQDPADVVVWTLDPARMAQASPRDRERIQRLYDAGIVRKIELQRQLAERKATVGEVTSDQAALNAITDILESRRLGMTANGSTYGNIWLRAKSKVIVEGTCERSNGEWYVSSVTNRIDSGGFKTDFKCVR